MAIRNIRTLGDDILRAKAKEITEMTPRIEELIDDMFDTMYEARAIGSKILSNRYSLPNKRNRLTGNKYLIYFRKIGK